MKAISNSPEMPFPPRYNYAEGERVVLWSDKVPHNLQIHVQAQGLDNKLHNVYVGEGAETLFFRHSGFVKNREEAQSIAQGIFNGFKNAKAWNETERQYNKEAKQFAKGAPSNGKKPFSKKKGGKPKAA